MKYNWSAYAGHSAKAVTVLMKIGRELSEEICAVTDKMAKARESTRKQLQSAILEREDGEARKAGCEPKLPQTCCKLHGLTKIGMGACERLPLGDAKRLFPLVSGVIRLSLAKSVVKRFAGDAEAAKAAVKDVLAKAVSRELCGDALAEAVAELTGSKGKKTKLAFWERAAKLLAGKDSDDNAAEMLLELQKTGGAEFASDLLAKLADLASQAAQAQEMSRAA